ncbi:bacterial extracellular solute-binding protein, family 5 [delta proteobacterium NaphS2]|nr:bacterial extracellular solute-binding protein, family 5 [delta proteobacterium NaphS2]
MNHTKNRIVIFFRVLILMLSSLFLFSSGVWAKDPAKEIRIADGKGDWGYPNAFQHYPRGPGYLRMAMVFDTLVWKDANGNIPALAKNWRYDPESLRFIFQLQEGVLWHDGKPFTADDVVFTIDYFKKHPYQWVPLGKVAGAERLGLHSVSIQLKEPYAPFMAYVGGTMPILPRHIWEKVDDPKRYQDPNAFIGTGPYRFVDFDSTKGTYLFEANKDYYLGKPVVDRVIYIKAKNPLMALLSHKADLVNIKPDMAAHLKKKGMVILTSPRGWNKKLMINHKKSPLNDKRFRKALAYAINQQEIIDKAHRGFGSPASFGLLSPDHVFYNPDTPQYPHNPEKARKILASLGYQENEKGFMEKNGTPLRLEVLISNITVAGESMADRDGEVLKKQLENVGISVDLVNLEQATADAKVRNWEFDLAVTGHGGLLGDAMTLERMISPRVAGSVNSARYGANRELLELLDAQMTEMNEEKRKAIVYEIQRIYADELPAISLYYPVSMAAYNPEKGIAWYYTKGGIALGIPIAQNKMALIE